jgi:hypothetical protein
MQEAMGVGVDLPMALDAVYVEAHTAVCLYKDLCEIGGDRGGAFKKDL